MNGIVTDLVLEIDNVTNIDEVLPLLRILDNNGIRTVMSRRDEPDRLHLAIDNDREDCSIDMIVKLLTATLVLTTDLTAVDYSDSVGHAVQDSIDRLGSPSAKAEQ